MRVRIFLIGFAGALAGCFHLSPRKTGIVVLPLDGTTWDVTITPDEAAAKEGEKAFKDTIVFDNGQVWMTECLGYGFEPSQYATSRQGGKDLFATEQSSSRNGRSSWSAEITGDTIEGKMAWTKEDGRLLHYTFAGKKTSS